MLWLMIVLLLSLLAMLFAAAGVASHIHQRAKFRSKPVAGAAGTLDPVEEAGHDLELEDKS